MIGIQKLVKSLTNELVNEFFLHKVSNTQSESLLKMSTLIGISKNVSYF